jgi:hypothetical protein
MQYIHYTSYIQDIYIVCTLYKYICRHYMFGLKHLFAFCFTYKDLLRRVQVRLLEIQANSTARGVYLSWSEHVSLACTAMYSKHSLLNWWSQTDTSSVAWLVRQSRGHCHDEFPGLANRMWSCNMSKIFPEGMDFQFNEFHCVCACSISTDVKLVFVLDLCGFFLVETSVTSSCSGVQHLWHTACNEAVAIVGRGGCSPPCSCGIPVWTFEQTVHFYCL